MWLRMGLVNNCLDQRAGMPNFLWTRCLRSAYAVLTQCSRFIIIVSLRWLKSFETPLVNQPNLMRLEIITSIFLLKHCVFTGSVWCWSLAIQVMNIMINMIKLNEWCSDACSIVRENLQQVRCFIIHTDNHYTAIRFAQNESKTPLFIDSMRKWPVCITGEWIRVIDWQVIDWQVIDWQVIDWMLVSWRARPFDRVARELDFSQRSRSSGFRWVFFSS